MTYNITKSDGTPLVDIQDGTIDQTTDLKLIGKNSTVFGQSLNENLVYLLENFSNSSPPSKPLTGQLWYNTEESRLQIYTGNVNGWRATGAPIVNQENPLSLITGDFWIDSKNKQLYFYDGTALTLAGPSWTKDQGQTGFVPNTIYDNFGNAKTILQLYVHDSLLGIFSSVDFTPKPTIPGFTSLTTGYNSNSLIASSFGMTATNSLKLGGVVANNYLRSDIPASMSGPLSVTSSSGIIIGPLSNVNLNFSGISFNIENTQENGDISIKTKNSSGTTDRIHINANSGLVTITGNLEVTGKTLTKPIVLTLIDNDILDSLQSKTILILKDLANESNYLNNQQALVHYQHINGASITRYLKRFVITGGSWTYDRDLTSSV